jgi:hypothetical protein
MKNLIISLIILSFATFAQSQTIPPPYINYQAVLYDVNGPNPNAVLATTNLATYVNIQDELGNLLYKEEHFSSTDANGQITIKIGDGVYLQGPITNFNQINWGTGKYYLIVDFDINGTISSTAPEQLVTVPYSFYAGKAGNGMTAVADNGNGTLTFTYANGQTYITPALSGIQGPIGPAGPQGLQGPQGVQGIAGPQGPIGLTGATGLTGPQGVAGTNGTAVLNGNSNPLTTTGANGDFYINTATNTLFGPKASGAWPTGVSLVGPTGATGAQGPQGVQGIAGPQGPIGLTGATGVAGAQGPQGIQGPQGASGLLTSGSVAGNTAYWNGTTWVTNNSNIFNNGGNVGIGTTTPTVKLEVNGRLKTLGINELSDARYKKNITTLTNALANIEKLRGVSYDWKQSEFPEKNFDAKHQIGLIAQELELVYPELVNTDAEGFKSVDYSKLVAVLIEAVKEQQNEIDALQVQVSQQGTQMDELKASLTEIYKIIGVSTKK